MCAAQTPTITYILADNQIPGAGGFEKHGILKCAGDVRTLGAGGLSEKLLNEAVNLCSNYGERIIIADRMKTVIDGHGAERIVQKVSEVWNQNEMVTRK